MAMKTYARIVNGVVAELIPLDDSLDPSEIFAPSVTLVDVTSASPAAAVGQVAVETGTAWTFSAPPAPAPIVPQQVTIYQAKAVLFGMPGAEAGMTLLDDVNTWAAAQGGLLQLAWTEATVVTRNGDFVTQGAANFGWTPATLDGMFTAAALIQA